MTIADKPLLRSVAAFTLLELLSVVAILGVLLTLLLPMANRAMDAARKGACTANLRTIGSAVQLIVADENGSLPGVGKRTPTSSAAWQDVLNVWAFESTGRDPLQRIGEKRQPGKMYCPAMKAWPQGGTRYPRAYVMNTYVPDYSAGTIASYNGIYDYQPGRRLAAFASPARTILVTESERNGD
ncbi:MAG: type II secretion system protein, partial [Terrimicrobiaceae bacterium]